MGLIDDAKNALAGDDPVYVISKDAAEKVIKSITKYYEIDIDGMEDKEAKKFVKANYDRLVKSARLGRLKVDFTDGITVTQILRSGEELKYREIDGKAKAATAGKEKDDFYGRIYAIMGSLCGLGENGILKLKGVDISLCEVLGAIFLQC